MSRFMEPVMRKLVVAALLITPAIACANVVWPALYLETRLFSWWAISVGLVIEYLFVRWLFGLTPGRAAVADLFANAASAVVGVVLIPVSGIVWELFPASIYNWAFEWGTFNPITWTSTFFIACVINALLEGFVYKKVFKLDLKIKSKKFWWLVLANTFSVGVAFASLWIAPLHLWNITLRSARAPSKRRADVSPPIVRFRREAPLIFKSYRHECFAVFGASRRKDTTGGLHPLYARHLLIQRN